MKTIKEHLESLPEPYREKALKNAQAELLDLTEVSTAKAISSSFTWCDTPEGIDYWKKVYDETASIYGH